jgi:hypothetical protein
LHVDKVNENLFPVTQRKSGGHQRITELSL